MRVLLLEYIYQLDCLLDCFAALWAYLIEDGLEWLRFPSAGRRTDVITNTLVPSGSNGNLNLIHTYTLDGRRPEQGFQPTVRPHEESPHSIPTRIWMAFVVNKVS
ncbi:hypothetical protein M8818_005063 [Zalaria obscura]|uniref:Uncharacterized protein n=1 Tax=Zalaria obscura TaxID=2024903 RepID=A0ACC3SAY4_9PEZI